MKLFPTRSDSRIDGPAEAEGERRLSSRSGGREPPVILRSEDLRRALASGFGDRDGSESAALGRNMWGGGAVLAGAIGRDPLRKLACV